MRSGVPGAGRGIGVLIVDALMQGPFLVFSIEFPGTERERQAMVDIKLAVSGPWSLLFPLPGPPGSGAVPADCNLWPVIQKSHRKPEKPERFH